MLLDDKDLLARCDLHTYKASGPGGQHRNKVSSAVRLRHRQTGVTAQAAESRSQHDNRRVGLRRLRMNLACRCRHPVNLADAAVPAVVAECLSGPRAACGPAGKTPPGGKEHADAPLPKYLNVGRKDARFWPVAAFLLDVLDAADGRVAPAARAVGISTANLVRFLKTDRHLLGAAQTLRKQHDRKPIT